MKRNSLFGAVVIALSIGTAADVAAFGMPKFGGSEKQAVTSSPQSIENLQAQQDSLVKTYQSSLGDILDAQALLLKAHGKKKEAAELESTATALGNGVANKAQIEMATEHSDEANETIRKLTEEQVALTAEGREQYQKSLLPYAGGVAKMARMRPELQEFMKAATEQVKNASMMNKMKVKNQLEVGMYIGKQAPGYISSVMSTTGKLATYAKKQGVSEQTTEKLMMALDGE